MTNSALVIGQVNCYCAADSRAIWFDITLQRASSMRLWLLSGLYGHTTWYYIVEGTSHVTVVAYRVLYQCDLRIPQRASALIFVVAHSIYDHAT